MKKISILVLVFSSMLFASCSKERSVLKSEVVASTCRCTDASKTIAGVSQEPVALSSCACSCDGCICGTPQAALGEKCACACLKCGCGN